MNRTRSSWTWIPAAEAHHSWKNSNNSTFPCSSNNHLMPPTNCETYAEAFNVVLSITLPSSQNSFLTSSSYSSPSLSLSSLLSSFISLLPNSTPLASTSSSNYHNQPSPFSPSSPSRVSSQGTNKSVDTLLIHYLKHLIVTESSIQCMHEFAVMDSGSFCS